MSNTTISPNMNLTIPVVGTESGPQWATDINNCLNSIDSHSHLTGYGVPVPTGGININSDLPLNGFNTYSARSYRLSPQNAVLSLANDIGCLYEVTNDLYFNDGIGRQIRMTQNGAIAGTVGSIANLVSPASASFNSGSATFIWQSAANTSAIMDAGSVIIRNATANSFGVTLAAPAALGSNFTLVLPTLPSVQNIMTLDASGNIAAPWNVDNTTIEISANNLKVKVSGLSGITGSQIAATTITNSNIAFDTITGAKITANTVSRTNLEGYTISSSAQLTTPVTAISTQTLLGSLTITTTGRPVIITCQSFDPTSASSSSFGLTDSAASAVLGTLSLSVNGGSTFKYRMTMQMYAIGNPTATLVLPSSSYYVIDTPAASTITYSLYVIINSSNTTFTCANTKLLAYELY